MLPNPSKPTQTLPNLPNPPKPSQTLLNPLKRSHPPSPQPSKPTKPAQTFPNLANPPKPSQNLPKPFQTLPPPPLWSRKSEKVQNKRSHHVIQCPVLERPKLSGKLAGQTTGNFLQFFLGSSTHPRTITGEGLLGRVEKRPLDVGPPRPFKT